MAKTSEIVHYWVRELESLGLINRGGRLCSLKTVYDMCTFYLYKLCVQVNYIYTFK